MNGKSLAMLMWHGLNYVVMELRYLTRLLLVPIEDAKMCEAPLLSRVSTKRLGSVRLGMAHF